MPVTAQKLPPLAIITGATSGIGMEISRQLLQQGWHIKILCRDVDAGHKLAENWSRQADVEVIGVDLASLASVKSAAQNIVDAGRPVAALINNAGLVQPGGGLSKHGYEIHFAVMHLGHWLLTQTLLPLLEADANRRGRVISVSAWGHLMAKPDFSTAYGLDTNAIRAYSRAKLAQVAATAHWARLHASGNVDFFSLHPGIVRTQLDRSMSGLARALVARLAVPAATAANLPVALATITHLKAASGTYFSFSTFKRRYVLEAAKRSVHAEHGELGDGLFALSADMVSKTE